MSVKVGAQSATQYIAENSAESPPTSVRFRLPGMVTASPMDIRFGAKVMRQLNAPGAADGRATGSVQASKNSYEWSVNYVPMKRSSAPKYDFRHYAGLFLNNTSSTADAGAWTYGTSTTTDLRTFTLFKEIDNLQHQLNGCKGNRWTMRSSLDTPVECESQGFASAATFADLTRTDATNLRDGTPFMWSDVQIFLDSSLATNVVAFELNVNNVAEAFHVLGDKNPRGVVAKARNVDITITRQYQDIAQYTDGKNNVAKRVTIRLDDAVDADIILTGCKLDEHPLPAAEPDAGPLTHVLRLLAKDVAVN